MPSTTTACSVDRRDVVLIHLHLLVGETK
jgi:hypothetical protein